MKLTCTVSRLADGKWLARHAGSSTGQVEVTGPTREEALTKMRNELQYRIELCPCSGASGDTVELQVSEDAGRVGLFPWLHGFLAPLLILAATSPGMTDSWTDLSSGEKALETWADPTGDW